MEELGLNNELLKGVGTLMDNFKEFRREKRVTKKIKFKADVIKPKGEDAKTMDKVCQVLVA